MAPTDIAVLVFILSAFAVFISTLAWVSRAPSTAVRKNRVSDKGRQQGGVRPSGGKPAAA